MKITGFVTHSDCSLHDTGWNHPEHQGRLPAVARAVYRDMMTLFEPLLEIEASPASEADLCLAHTPEYIESVKAAVATSVAAGAVVDLANGTRVSARSWDAGVAAVGAGITAASAVMEGRVRNAFCAVRPPGHRVGRSAPDGYGIFNTAAVTALSLIEHHQLERVLVLDVGARKGAGTLDILRGDARAAVLSIHGPRDPGVGSREDWQRSISLDSGAGLETMSESVTGALREVAEIFEPQVIVLSLGCDVLATDPTGDLALVPSDFFVLTRLVVEAAEGWCGGRVISVLEEGYDADGMGRAVVQHLRALANLPPAD